MTKSTNSHLEMAVDTRYVGTLVAKMISKSHQKQTKLFSATASQREEKEKDQLTDNCYSAS